MDGLKLKYDIAYDSWVLEPIHVPNNNTTHRTTSIPVSDHRHSAETFTFFSESSARQSCSSATPLRQSFSQNRRSASPRFYFIPDPTTSRDVDNNGKFWKSWKKYWTCLKPPTDNTHHHAMRPTKKDKRKIECCGGASLAKKSPLTTYYTAMNSEERDEHIRAVVLYCKSTSS